VLVALVIVGSVTRPSGSDSYPPKVGTVVPYAYAQPIVDLDAQADRYGWPNLGIIGNLEHLRKHGGHTPWRAGSKRGVVWAMDRTMPDGFREWLVKTCKSNYDTSWIRFFNAEGRQYDWGGNDQGPSSDHHLHLEVQDGHELTHVTLFDDYAEETDMAGLTTDEHNWLEQINRLLHDGKRLGSDSNQTSNGGVPTAYIVREIAAIKKALGIITAEVDTLEEGDAGILAMLQALPSGGGDAVDAEAIVNELLAKLPPAVLDLLSARLTA
jgi:hypothetical protein